MALCVGLVSKPSNTAPLGGILDVHPDSLRPRGERPDAVDSARILSFILAFVIYSGL